MSNELTVANTILEQLGGRRFVAMTGARGFVGSSNALSFKLPIGKARAVRVELTAGDDYTVQFFGRSYKVIATREGVYCDQLRDVFETETGLCTSLGTMGRRS